MKIRTVLKVARSGDVRARVTAIRDAQAAVRVAAVTAGLRTGTLDHLRSGPDSVAGIAGKRAWSDQVLVEGLLQVLAMLGLVERRGGTWMLTRRGSALLEDDVARATYEGFGGYHVGLYGGIWAEGNPVTTSWSTVTSSPESRGRWIPSWRTP